MGKLAMSQIQTYLMVQGYLNVTAVYVIHEADHPINILALNRSHISNTSLHSRDTATWYEWVSSRCLGWYLNQRRRDFSSQGRVD